SARALPGLAVAEHAAEGAALDLERIGALQRNRRVVIAATVGIMNPARPLAALRLHVDQDPCAGVDGIAAQIGAAFLDANVALALGAHALEIDIAERAGVAGRGDLDAGNAVAVARRFNTNALAVDLERNSAGMRRGGGHQQCGENVELLHESLLKRLASGWRR